MTFYMSDFLFVLAPVRSLRRIRAWNIDSKRWVARVPPIVAGVFLMFVLGIGGVSAAQLWHLTKDLQPRRTLWYLISVSCRL